MGELIVVVALANAMVLCGLAAVKMRGVSRSDQGWSRRCLLELAPGALAAGVACLAAGAIWSATIGQGAFATALLTAPGAVVWLVPSLAWGAFKLRPEPADDPIDDLIDDLQPTTIPEQRYPDPADLHETLRHLADEIVDPLTVILLTMELAENDGDEAPSQQIQAQLRRIQGAVDRLLAVTFSVEPAGGDPAEIVH